MASTLITACRCLSMQTHPTFFSSIAVHVQFDNPNASRNPERDACGDLKPKLKLEWPCLLSFGAFLSNAKGMG